MWMSIQIEKVTFCKKQLVINWNQISSKWNQGMKETKTRIKRKKTPWIKIIHEQNGDDLPKSAINAYRISIIIGIFKFVAMRCAIWPQWYMKECAVLYAQILSWHLAGVVFPLFIPYYECVCAYTYLCYPMWTLQI